MTYKKFLKIKHVCAGLLILGLIASIFVPVLPSVDPSTVKTKSAEAIQKE